jgi:hypothetical protein
MQAAGHRVDRPVLQRPLVDGPEPDDKLVADVSDGQEIDDPGAGDAEARAQVDAVFAADREGAGAQE